MTGLINRARKTTYTDITEQKRRWKANSKHDNCHFWPIMHSC